MPIYEYECTECGHFEEVLQKFSDPPVAECPHCKGAMKKLMSMNSFHLKGSGWYVTDYASQSKSSASSTTPSGGGEGGSGSSAKSKDADASGSADKKSTE